MGLPNPFNQTSGSVPAERPSLESMLPMLRSWWSFGGEALTDLYITSARKGMSEAQLAQYPLTGGLFRLHTEVQGMSTFAYGN